MCTKFHNVRACSCLKIACNIVKRGFTHYPQQQTNFCKPSWQTWYRCQVAEHLVNSLYETLSSKIRHPVAYHSSTFTFVSSKCHGIEGKQFVHFIEKTTWASRASILTQRGSTFAVQSTVSHLKWAQTFITLNIPVSYPYPSHSFMYLSPHSLWLLSRLSIISSIHHGHTVTFILAPLNSPGCSGQHKQENSKFDIWTD